MTWELIDQEDDKPVSEGFVVRDRRGIEMVVCQGVGRPPHKPSSTGRVWVKPLDATQTDEDTFISTAEYFPGVFGLEWRDV